MVKVIAGTSSLSHVALIIAEIDVDQLSGFREACRAVGFFLEMTEAGWQRAFLWTACMSDGAFTFFAIALGTFTVVALLVLRF